MTKPNKNNIDEVIDELIAIMIGFEEMTDEKDKAEKRPKIIIDFLKQKLQQVSDRKVEEISVEVEKHIKTYRKLAKEDVKEDKVIDDAIVSILKDVLKSLKTKE